MQNSVRCFYSLDENIQLNGLFDNTLNGGRTDYPDDNVSGYKISQLQSTVKNSSKLEYVKDYLRDEYFNSTEANLDDLFIFYINVENTRKQ